MFTLKLYQNGPLPPEGRAVIMEVVGLWIDHCDKDVKFVRAFKKTVGVEDEGGTFEAYVGGNPGGSGPGGQVDTDSAITFGRGGNYFSWGVLENAQGKTTEMLR